MIRETIYLPSELQHGVCRCCREESDEIVTGDGRCVDCIEADRFYEETMDIDPDDYFY